MGRKFRTHSTANSLDIRAELVTSLASSTSMSRQVFSCSAINPYHVTARSINRDWFGASMEQVWSIVCDELYFTKHSFNLKVHSFVLMSNHIHLLVTTPERNLSPAMQFFLSRTSREIPKITGRINNTWARRFKRCEIQSYQYFLNAYKYVYRNPVEAGLVDRVEAYPYSSLSGKLGLSKLKIPIEEDSLLFSHDINQQLQWLNVKPTTTDYESVKKALRRKIFTLPKIDNNRNPLEQIDATL